jgi:hypothetical protein
MGTLAWMGRRPPGCGAARPRDGERSPTDVELHDRSSRRARPARPQLGAPPTTSSPRRILPPSWCRDKFGGAPVDGQGRRPRWTGGGWVPGRQDGRARRTLLGRQCSRRRDDGARGRAGPPVLSRGGRRGARPTPPAEGRLLVSARDARGPCTRRAAAASLPAC